MSSQLLTIRVDQKLKKLIEQDADLNETSVSEHVRSLLYQIYEFGEYLDEGIPITTMSINLSFEKDNLQDLSTVGMWIIMNYNGTAKNDVDTLLSMQSKLTKLTNDETLTYSLRSELTKILNDVRRVLEEHNGLASLLYTHPNNVYTIDIYLVYNEINALLKKDESYE